MDIFKYLPNFILETSDKLDRNIPELIFTTFQVHYDLNLQNRFKGFKTF